MVYCGGLENRCGLIPTGGSNPSLSASFVEAGRWRKIRLWPENWKKFVNSWIHIVIWVAVIGAIFAFLWWQGQIKKLALYIQETREELAKCSWPSREELKGSTALIIISIILLGTFTVAVDQVLYLVFFKLF